MRIIIDIGHPAHIHYFKHAANAFINNGHKVLFTTRDKEVTIYLLENYNFDYENLGKPFKQLYKKILGLLIFDFKLFKVSLKFKPDIFLSAGSIYASHIAWLFHKPHLTLEDTGNMEQIRLYLPFTDIVFTPESFHKNLGRKQIRYNGYHELAYLHPNRFFPDSTIREILGLKENDRFIILRFVSWNATHDYNQKGFTDENKREIVDSLCNYGKVFITSEERLSEEFEKFKIKIPSEKIHDVLAAADLYIGEGATMASECTMLGTPAIYVNSMEAGTIDDQEKNGLLFHFRNFDGVLDRVSEILNNPNSRKEFKEKRDRMLKDKIDVTAFLIWFVEGYPGSIKIMRENPDYQNNFK